MSASKHRCLLQNESASAVHSRRLRAQPPRKGALLSVVGRSYIETYRTSSRTENVFEHTPTSESDDGQTSDFRRIVRETVPTCLLVYCPTGHVPQICLMIIPSMISRAGAVSNIGPLAHNKFSGAPLGHISGDDTTFTNAQSAAVAANYMAAPS